MLDSSSGQPIPVKPTFFTVYAGCLTLSLSKSKCFSKPVRLRNQTLTRRWCSNIEASPSFKLSIPTLRPTGFQTCGCQPGELLICKWCAHASRLCQEQHLTSRGEEFETVVSVIKNKSLPDKRQNITSAEGL